jgi:hypothetical protein
MVGWTERKIWESVRAQLSETILRMSYEGCGDSEVHFRALWRKATGGGGRMRQATEMGRRERIRHKLVCSLIYT